ncbi:MAG: deoxyribodipyrimidine photo-lyase [Planctomycetota bacterium]
MTPEIRIRPVNDRPERVGQYVLYWMIASRRTHDNFGLQRAAERARELGKPLVVFEPLRKSYPWRSDRIEEFVLRGMRTNAARCREAGVAYLPHVGDDSTLLRKLAAEASLVVTDDYPCFFLPRMVESARLDVRLEAVDSNGILPMAAADRDFPTAYAFRRFLQKNLPQELPEPDPLHGVSGACIPWSFELPDGPESDALERWRAFRVEDYGRRYTSGLSADLHFGHLGSHTLFRDLADGWTPHPPHNGRRSGWWGLSEPVEAYLDQLVTWRELGFNFCHRRDDYDRYESLPAWAQKTLDDHAADEREHLYTLEEFEAAETHDPLWNAAQRQLVRDGTIHSYLRMLWGKKILEWSGSPREALAIMIELNNKYALDGRDPNSYSGIFWVLGRYDRAWGPERPIYGKIRYMSSENTARKLPVKAYMEQYA